eukprot:766842-Hanusia_phi.AAC.13
MEDSEMGRGAERRSRNGQGERRRGRGEGRRMGESRGGKEQRRGREQGKQEEREEEGKMEERSGIVCDPERIGAGEMEDAKQEKKARTEEARICGGGCGGSKAGGCWRRAG